MRNAAFTISLDFDQILQAVKQLPKKEKIKLSKELEKDEIGNALSRLLRSFQTDDLPLEIIESEVETVRQGLYEKSKKR